MIVADDVGEDLRSDRQRREVDEGVVVQVRLQMSNPVRDMSSEFACRDAMRVDRGPEDVCRGVRQLRISAATECQMNDISCLLASQ